MGYSMKSVSMWVVLGMSLSIVFCTEIMAADNAQPVRNSTDATSRVQSQNGMPTTQRSTIGAKALVINANDTPPFGPLLRSQPKSPEPDNDANPDPTMPAKPNELNSLSSARDEAIALMAD